MKHADAEAEQDALLDPGVDPPAGGRSGVRRGGADLASFKGCPQLEEDAHGRWIGDRGSSCLKSLCHSVFKFGWIHRTLSLSSWLAELSGARPGPPPGKCPSTA